MAVPPLNPAVARKQQQPKPIPTRFRPPSSVLSETIGAGPKRTYLDIQSAPPNVAYPPRPVPGSAVDLDIIMDNCDFSTNKYVRDCLEVLRVGAGLDNENRMRRGNTDDWKYIYMEEDRKFDSSPPIAAPQQKAPYNLRQTDPNEGLVFRKGEPLEEHIVFGPPRTYRPYAELQEPCDPDYPRIFHMFWTGPFTDKPYVALMSFLFTQNLGLHIPPGSPGPDVCRPQFWLWINPGPAAMAHNPSAVHDMYEILSNNPWSSPFLHPRFKDVIQFKIWNTTEQLDSISEIKDSWRTANLFNSGGHVISVPTKKKAPKTTSIEEVLVVVNGTGTAPEEASATGHEMSENDMFQRTGSTSQDTYDRLSVILSDLARFVLCHRFGGTYLDADTILLRDWEELWGWKGAFAYRWSRLEKYNTAVLRLNKNSALGSFLFKTALRNGLDFHPMTISQYTKDAHLEGLLLRLPDALFDSAWLNTEDYQRDRPPFPFFTEFAHFFETPAQHSAAPQALGIEGFFRGAFSYHFHNFWWKPFDPIRNWPDLGQRFIKGETVARKRLFEQKLNSTRSTASTTPGMPGQPQPVLQELPITEEDYMSEDAIEEDKRDLDWATVLKRTFEAYIRGERPNLYGEWITW
ncbi:hypothetical protein M422DRAFT_259730 [Sphaerobolus stellatus SS14]|uniref:Glycosyltransferase family 32 protein n=1 Tax=Sphaerobolus stellatus (strain SS14) TaxID=990650 RepID=A0A0C9VJP2_SPHS4|nr:hypothetical protein M422DRAFT_259730 [Sphaerobolus stellatus SS14]